MVSHVDIIPYCKPFVPAKKEKLMIFKWFNMTIIGTQNFKFNKMVEKNHRRQTNKFNVYRKYRFKTTHMTSKYTIVPVFILPNSQLLQNRICCIYIQAIQL